MNRIFSFLLIILMTMTALIAKDKKLIANNLKLHVTENDGRFILYGRKDKKERWLPLIFEDFPSTTFFRFFKGDHRVPFGEGGKGHYAELKIVDNRISYFWSDDELKISLDYELVSSGENMPLDTLVIDITVESLTEDDFEINYFFCLDSYLGESSARHFILPGNVVIDSEGEIGGGSQVSYISSYNEKYGTGLGIAFNQPKQLKPTRVFFANWKRIEQEGGDYKVKEGRNFDLKPYSINDSALVAEYYRQPVLFSRNHHNRIILSLTGELELEDEEIVEEKKEVVEEIVESSEKVKDEALPDESQEGVDLINMSLEELLALLDRINKKLESGEKLTKEDIELSARILAELQKR